MNFGNGTHRTGPEPGEEPSHTDNGGTANSDGTGEDTDDTPVSTGDPSVPSDDQCREWRRWIVETFLPAEYGVVPVDHLVDRICEREPENVTRSTVQRALTESVLPGLDRDGSLDYDATHELVINYGE